MAKTVLTAEIAAYIKANYLKQSGSSIAAKFKIDKGIVYRFEKNNNLVVPVELKKKFRLEAFLKARKGKTNFTKKEDAFIKENYLKLPVKRIADILGRSGVGINVALKRLNLSIPQELADQRRLDGMYRKGSVPVNKGKKQIDYMSAENIEKTKATRFAKGHIPHNSVNVSNGDISIRKDNRGVAYKWIRVKRGIWIPLSIYNWELKYGPIPKGYLLRFIDNNSMNCEPDNLEVITRQENMMKNTIHQYPQELKETIKLISKINRKLKNV